jgi:type IV pilus biogenesis protein PilP
MSSNKQARTLIATLILLAMASPVMAETPAEQIKRINEEIAVLSAKLGEIEMKAKIAAKEEEIRKIGVAGSASSAFGNSGRSDELPIVRSIDGVDGKLKATLLMRNGGGLQTLAEGDKFGVWTVKKISVNAVSLAKGKEVTTLTFGTDPSSQQTGGAGTGQYGNTAVGQAGPGGTSNYPAPFPGR